MQMGTGLDVVVGWQQHMKALAQCGLRINPKLPLVAYQIFQVTNRTALGQHHLTCSQASASPY